MPSINSLSSLLATRIAQLGNLQARDNQDDATVSLINRVDDEIMRIVREFMPSGSGFDNGTTIDLDKSTTATLVFNTSFHHMNDVGAYDGWTEHKVIMTATFAGPNIKVTGKDRRGIKDYIAETFLLAIAQRIETIWDDQHKYMTFVRKLEA